MLIELKSFNSLSARKRRERLSESKSRQVPSRSLTTRYIIFVILSFMLMISSYRNILPLIEHCNDDLALTVDTFPFPLQSPSQSVPKLHASPEKHTAIVIRTVMPIHTTVLDHMVQIMRVLHHKHTKSRFQHYDVVVLVDETRMGGAQEYIQHYFDRLSDVPMPLVYNVTENMIREDLRPGLDRYIDGPLVSGERNQTKLMWQLLAPTFVSFIKNFNRTYKQAWVVEDDFWAIGKGLVPMLDMIYEWDKAIERDHSNHSGLAGIRTFFNICPFSPWVKGKHTQAFQDILVQMMQTDEHEKWKAYRFNDDFQKNWSYTKNQQPVTMWSCLTDAIYRHTRDFSLYMHDQIKEHGVFRWAEGFQQPLAWKGKFDIVDLKKIKPQEPVRGFKGHYNLTGARFKMTEAEAIRKHLLSYAGYTFMFHNRLPESIPMNVTINDQRSDG